MGESSEEAQAEQQEGRKSLKLTSFQNGRYQEEDAGHEGGEG